MREIKFRGKRVDNGEWVYGNFVHIAGKNFQEHHITSFEAWGDNNKVNPETVGQYIGLKDKNGKEVFEGDIISDGQSTYQVKFRIIETYSRELVFGSSVLAPAENIEVIGNVYDEIKKESPGKG